MKIQKLWEQKAEDDRVNKIGLKVCWPMQVKSQMNVKTVKDFHYLQSSGL